MGYYIQTAGLHGKAEEIVAKFAGKIISCPKSFSEISINIGLICVVDNGGFEAAGFCYNEREFLAFTLPFDYRLKKWVLISRVDAERETNFRA